MNRTTERLAALAAGPIFGGTAPQYGINVRGDALRVAALRDGTDLGCRYPAAGNRPVHGPQQGHHDADDLQPLVSVRPHRAHDRPGSDERSSCAECGANATRLNQSWFWPGSRPPLNCDHAVFFRCADLLAASVRGAACGQTAAEGLWLHASQSPPRQYD